MRATSAARAAAAVAAVGAGGLAYSAGYEVRSYRLRRALVPVLPPGARPLRVLHLTDLHLTPASAASRSGSARSTLSSRTW
jgi:hypothetical protein